MKISPKDGVMRRNHCYLYANKISDICTPVGEKTDKKTPSLGLCLPFNIQRIAD